MSHLKRQKMPKNWPVNRKGTKYMVRPASGDVPILVILRDILKIAQNKKEAKKALYTRLVKVNQKDVLDEKKGLTLFDTITLVPSSKNYRLNLKHNGKYLVEEIKATESTSKISKIKSKKTLKGKKVQINLVDGNNFISDLKCSVGDSVVIDFKKKKLEKCLPLKEKAKIIVFSGKHAGKTGTIKKMHSQEANKVSGKTSDEKSLMVVADLEGKDVNILIKQLMVTA